MRGTMLRSVTRLHRVTHRTRSRVRADSAVIPLPVMALQSLRLRRVSVVSSAIAARPCKQFGAIE